MKLTYYLLPREGIKNPSVAVTKRPGESVLLKTRCALSIDAKYCNTSDEIAMSCLRIATALIVKKC